MEQLGPFQCRKQRKAITSFSPKWRNERTRANGIKVISDLVEMSQKCSEISLQMRVQRNLDVQLPQPLWFAVGLIWARHSWKACERLILGFKGTQITLLLDLSPCDTATDLQSWHQLLSPPSCLWDGLLASPTAFKSKNVHSSKREGKRPSTSLEELKLCVGTQGVLTTGKSVSFVLANVHSGPWHYFFPLIVHTETFHRIFNNFQRSYRVFFIWNTCYESIGISLNY